MYFYVAICDDNRFCNQLLSDFIKKYNSDTKYNIISNYFLNGISLLKQDLQKYHIFILDIEMDGINGIETALEIRKQNKRAVIWFLTGSSNYLMEGYQAEAYKYLLKPLYYESFCKEFYDTIRWLKEKAVHVITIQNKGEFTQIDINDINYIEVFGHRLILHTDSYKIETVEALHTIESSLTNWDFYRIHRSYLINVNKVKTLRKTEIIMKNNKCLPLSKYKEKDFKEYYTRVCGTQLLI